MKTKMASIPAVKQRVYCATCHELVGVHNYPARAVEIPADDEPNIPQQIAMIHISTCPKHPALNFRRAT
jgi:hypothetical protein